MENRCPFEVNIYNAAATKAFVIPADQIGKSVKWRIVAAGGYDQAFLPLKGRRDDFPYLVRGRQVDFVYQHELSGGSIVPYLLYRGFVRRMKAERETAGQGISNTVRVELHGVFSRAVKGEAQKVYAEYPGMDRARIFSDLVTLFILNRMPQLEIDSPDVGDTLEYFNAYKVRLSEALETLAQDTGRVVYGGDAGPQLSTNLRRNRLYFRSVDDADEIKHTLIVPSEVIGARKSEEDTTNQATRLRVRGGAVRYPNLLAEAVGGNTSFEQPILPTGENGNLIIDPGFENRAIGGGFTQWDLNDGASRIAIAPDDADYTEDYGSVHSGKAMALLDGFDEKVSKKQNAQSGGMTTNAHYVYNARARQAQPGGLSTFEVRLRFLGVADAVLDTVTQVFEPGTSGRFENHPVIGICPSGCTGWDVRHRLTVDGGGGIVLDSHEFYNGSIKYQSGWEFHPTGSAVILVQDWAYTGNARSGAYSVYLSGTSSDVDNNDIVLRPLRQRRSGVPGNITLRGKVWVMSPPDATTLPKIQLQLRQYANGVYQSHGSEKQDYAASGTPLGVWTLYKVEVPLYGNTDEVEFNVALRGSGKILIDDIALEESEADENAFVEGDQYERIFYATDLFASGPVYDEATALEASEGGIEVLEERPEINNDTDGETYATAWFEQNLLPLVRPDIQTFGIVDTGAGLTNAQFWPGHNARAIGSEGQDLLPQPLPIWEVEGEWDGRLSLTPYLKSEKEDRGRKLREILRSNRFATGPATSSGRAFSSGSSGIGGGGAAPISLPLAMDLGGTGADNAADARNNLGLGTIAVENAGASGTITLFGPTTNGSITVVNGIITAFTDPT